MARPRKYYVVWLEGGGITVAHGYDAAAALSPAFKAFATERAAEEFAAWWQYRHG